MAGAEAVLDKPEDRAAKVSISVPEMLGFIAAIDQNLPGFISVMPRRVWRGEPMLCPRGVYEYWKESLPDKH
jgi:hypothetical protein